MATQWYLVIDGERRGPFSGGEVQDMVDDGKLHPRDLVWCDGMVDWEPAKNVLNIPDVARRRRPQFIERSEFVEGLGRPRSNSQFPGKLVTPGFFSFALLMFFLPWVNVQCNGVTAVSQSGFQACIGDYTESIGMVQRRLGNQPGFHMQDDKVSPAPLLWVYGLLIFMGLILGIALSVGIARLISLFLCALLGFMLLMVQLMAEFPITEQVIKANADPNLRRELRQQPFPFAPGFPQAPFVQVPGGVDLVRVTMTPWFWIGALATLSAIGGLALEHGIIFATANKRHRRLNV